MKGCITDIQRFSIHDGPGIRTTVFMKGCNLRCAWCHNPESQLDRPQLMYFENRCVHCGACFRVCQKRFTDDCTACGKCAAACRHGALEISGKYMTADEVFDVVIRDADYYAVSGGGVTFSGGEPLLQAEFLRETLQRFKTAGLNTAVETAGCVPEAVFEALLPLLDIVFFDIKAMCEETHVKLTGASNRQILANARELMRKAPEKLRFRMPLIPSVNDAELPEIAEFTKCFSLELMPYHAAGAGKYKALNRPYALKDEKPPELAYIRQLTARYEHVFCEENLI